MRRDTRKKGILRSMRSRCHHSGMANVVIIVGNKVGKMTLHNTYYTTILYNTIQQMNYIQFKIKIKILEYPGNK